MKRESKKDGHRCGVGFGEKGICVEMNMIINCWYIGTSRGADEMSE